MSSFWRRRMFFSLYFLHHLQIECLLIVIKILRLDCSPGLIIILIYVRNFLFKFMSFTQIMTILFIILIYMFQRLQLFAFDCIFKIMRYIIHSIIIITSESHSFLCILFIRICTNLIILSWLRNFRICFGSLLMKIEGLILRILSDQFIFWDSLWTSFLRNWFCRVFHRKDISTTQIWHVLNLIFWWWLFFNYKAFRAICLIKHFKEEFLTSLWFSRLI